MVGAPLMVKISPEAEPGAQTPSAARLGLARIERGVNGADHQRAVPGGRRNALGRASADVADGKDAATRALEHQRASIRPVPVLGEMRVAARLLAGDHEPLVVLADVVDQPSDLGEAPIIANTAEV